MLGNIVVGIILGIILLPIVIGIILKFFTRR